MENLSQFIFGLVDTAKSLIRNDTAHDEATSGRQKSLIYGDIKIWF